MVTQTPSLPATLKAPRQKRSAGKLAAILVATMQLLEESDFEQISMVQIAKRANISVGTIYTRFADKDSLFSYLIVELLRKQIDAFRTMFDEKTWIDIPLEQRVLYLTRLLLKSAELQPGVQRAIALRTIKRRTAPTDEEHAFHDESRAIAEQWLLACRSEIKAPDAEQSVAFALSFAFSSLQNFVLLRTDPYALPGAALADELARAMLGYLQHDVTLPTKTPPLRWPGAGFTEFPNVQAPA